MRIFDYSKKTSSTILQCVWFDSNLQIFENSKIVGNNLLHRKVRIFEYPDSAVMQCDLVQLRVLKCYYMATYS